MIYNSIIIGGGPAGVTAALYIKRRNIDDIMIIDTLKDSSLLTASYVDNYYGTEHILGTKLFADGITQAQSLGIKICTEKVIHIDINYENDNLLVTTNINTYETKTLVLATGKKRTSIKTIGFDSLTHGVSYCATCDGFFYRKKDIAVIGSKEFAIHEFEYLENIALTSYLLSNGESIEFSNKNVISSKIIKYSEDDSKITIEFEDREPIIVDGIFIALGDASSSDFAKQLGIEMDDNNNIKIDDKCKTNYENIFAAGDNTGGLAQIVKASYQGMIAGNSAGAYILKHK
ncbi:MAG: FAD-dependent oxidoreductase [Bacilli bacterium]